MSKKRLSINHILSIVLNPLAPHRRCLISLLWRWHWPRLVGRVSYVLQSWWYQFEHEDRPKVFGHAQVIKAPGARIVFGRNVTVNSSSIRAVASSLYAPVRLAALSSSASIIIGDNVGLNGTSITARSRCISLGDGTLIGPNVTIVDGHYHVLWPAESRGTMVDPEGDRDVIIGRNVWIGMQSMILKGVTIGDGSIIAAGSVVTSDIPPNVLAGGVPARIIRQLSEKDA